MTRGDKALRRTHHISKHWSRMPPVIWPPCNRWSCREARVAIRLAGQMACDNTQPARCATRGLVSGSRQPVNFAVYFSRTPASYNRQSQPSRTAVETRQESLSWSFESSQSRLPNTDAREETRLCCSPESEGEGLNASEPVWSAVVSRDGTTPEHNPHNHG